MSHGYDPKVTTEVRTDCELVGIAAVASNNVIGADGAIPWRIREDWSRFRALTSGNALIMGRKTHDSIGHPLPDRMTVVVTRDMDRDWSSEGVEAANSVEEAVERAVQCGHSRIYVAGGGEVYREAWNQLHRLEVTEVLTEAIGDTLFPAIDRSEWEETERDSRPAKDGEPAYAFVGYVRRSD